MMTEPPNQKIEGIIRQAEPQAKNIDFVEHGYDNIVAVVDKKKVYRFPRHDKARYWLIAEALILQELDGRLARTPKCTHLNREPVYSVQEFMAGHHLTEQEINSLPAKKQTEIADELVEFMVNYAKLITPQKLNQIHKSSGLTDSGIDEPWPAYLKRILMDSDYPGHPALEEMNRQYYQKWQNVVAGDSLPQLALHDDLHVQNLLFTDGQLSAILDFGDSSVGTATEEMRNFLRIGDDFLKTGIEKFSQATGQTIDPEMVRIWAITTELAALSKRLAADMTDSPGYHRAQNYLKRWLPDFKL